MKRNFLLGAAALAALVASVSAFQSTAPPPPITWIYGWTGGAYRWYSLGPTLTVANGQLDAQFPAQVAPKTRHYDVPLVYDAVKKGWTIPAGATSLVVHVNGIRYSPANYAIANGLLTAVSSNMLPEHEVTADYDALL